MRISRFSYLLAVIITVVSSLWYMGGNQDSGYVPMAVVASAVEMMPGSESEAADLPKLHLNGDISHMYEKSDERIVPFHYEDSKHILDGYVKIKIQGTSSLGYKKKNYTIKLYQDQACDNSLDVDVGWGEENKYCLKANWIDKTHARNIVTARIASQVQSKYNVLPDTPNQGLIDGFPIEIYNNGEFLGLYTWNIPKDEWLLNMDSDNPNHLMVCGETWEAPTLFMEAADFVNWEVEVGEGNEESLQNLNRLFTFVMESSDEEFKEHIHEYVNLDSVINYYLISDLAYLQDNLGKNMLIFTYDSKIWYLGLYDLDTSWGTYFDGKSLYDYEFFELRGNKLLIRIEECFADQLCARYFELRNDIFTKEHILNEFHTFANQIPENTFEKEVLRWGNEIPGYSYEQIEEYLDVRIPLLDEKYSNWNKWIRTRNVRILKIMMNEYEKVAEEAPKIVVDTVCILLLAVGIFTTIVVLFVKVCVRIIKRTGYKGKFIR